MIRKLRGRLDELGWADAIVDVGGVGYRLMVPLSTREALRPAAGGEVTLHVHTRVRPESVELFGFATPDELDAFELLLQAAGVGPRIALAALSTYPPSRIYEALAEGRLDALRRIPGVGPRLAERLHVELRERARERLAGGQARTPPGPKEAASVDGHPGFDDAVAALVALGYTRAEARRAVRSAATRTRPDQPLEALVRAALLVAGAAAEP